MITPHPAEAALFLPARSRLADIYVHLIQGASRNEVNRLDDLAFGGAGPMQKAGFGGALPIADKFQPALARELECRNLEQDEFPAFLRGLFGGLPAARHLIPCRRTGDHTMRPLIVAVLHVLMLLPSTVPAAEEPTQTAWNDGCPLQSLHSADNLLQSFKAKAKNLGKDTKLRILIIGDSLSDGHYHWSHYYRKNLQEAYGQGGFGNIVAGWGRGGAAGWLWDDKKDFTCEATGVWRDSFGGQGDAWPYLGWNGRFLCTDAPAAEWKLEAPGSRFTIVYSTGTFKTFTGKWQETRCAGFTAALDADMRKVEPATADQALDIGLLKFEVPEGRHALKINAVHDGVFFFHGVLVENSAPGVVLYNIAHGGWWAHDFILRQPGWEKILSEMNPDFTIIFLSKPESGGSGSPSQTNRNLEFELLTQRVKAALPQTQLLFFQNWSPRDGISPSDLQTYKDRIAWFESNHYPYLDLYAGLNKAKMKELGWYGDNIHLAQLGGKGIGDAISRLFLP